KHRITFFFFQAEDGIRDKLVTGVQTCALPISRGCRPGRLPRPAPLMKTGTPAASAKSRRSAAASSQYTPLPAMIMGRSAWAKRRSEERRVGKEGRAGWPPTPDGKIDQEQWTRA